MPSERADILPIQVYIIQALMHSQIPISNLSLSLSPFELAHDGQLLKFVSRLAIELCSSALVGLMSGEPSRLQT